MTFINVGIFFGGANLTKNGGFLVEAWAEASVTSLRLMGVMTRCGRCSCLDHVFGAKKKPRLLC